MSKLADWTISLSGRQKLFALFDTISNLAADHLTFEAGVACCEQQTYVRSTPLSLRKITFRRERSDDRKYVCCSQARNGLVVFQQEFFFLETCCAGYFLLSRCSAGYFFPFSLLCRIFFLKKGQSKYL